MAPRRLTLLVLPAIGLALAACPPKYPNCKTDEHCKGDGHSGVCVDGQCQECGREADCKKGFTCRQNKCVPKPECVTDPECPPGQKCRDEKCTPECAADKDCHKGMQCKAGRCTPSPECSSNADCPAGKICDPNGRCIDRTADTTQGGPCELETVRFDFNEFSLTADARKTLERDAECIKQRQPAVTVEGHCDERGTEEYNLHLGEKRANSVKKYLVTMGAEAGKLKSISYGKERPANPAHDESAWSQNRRVDFAEK